MYNRNLKITSLLLMLTFGCGIYAHAENTASHNFEKASHWIRINLDSALHYLDATVQESKQTNNYNLRARAYSLEGVAHFFKGNNDLSRQSVARAELLLDSVSDLHERATLKCNILMHSGVIANNSGLITKADSCYNAIIPIAIEYVLHDQHLLAIMNLGQVKKLQGNLYEAFTMFTDASHLCDSLKNNDLKQTVLNWMAQLLTEVQDFDLAISYLQKAKEYHPDVAYPGYIIEWYTNMGYAHYSASRPDSALHYYTQALELSEAHQLPYYKALAIANIGEIEYENGNYDKALPLLTEGLVMFRETENAIGEFYTLSIMSGAFFRSGEIKKGRDYLVQSELLLGSNELSAEALLRHYKRAYDLHKHLGDEKSALLAFENYARQKELIADKEIRWNIATLERQLRLLEKEKTIDDQNYRIQLYNLEINQYKMRLALLVIGATALLMILGFILYIQKSRREKEKNQLLAEMEKIIASYKLKNIQSCISPHFIFNALNSLLHLISKNKNKEAQKCIDHISKLIRYTIENSGKHAITLEEEVAFVRNYLELELLLERTQFFYDIKVDKTIDMQSQILPMSIQTHVENALKHGLMPQNKSGTISISLIKNEEKINILIEDNGEGFIPDITNRRVPGTGSGLKIQQEMIELYNRYNKSKISLHIANKAALTNGQEPGTRVQLSVPLQFSYELN